MPVPILLQLLKSGDNSMKSARLFNFPKSHVSVTSHPSPTKENHLTDEEKMSIIEEKFHEILETLGLDLEDESIAKTPYRMAKMYVQEIFSGLKNENFPSLCFINEKPYATSRLILVKDISLNSFCEHHLVPMTGVAHIAYIPNGKVIGLSKINRIAQYFCKRPQLQERLSAQIIDSLSTVLEIQDIAIFTELKHFCVTIRGVSDTSSVTYTHILKGKFEKDPLRNEFLTMIHQSD